MLNYMLPCGLVYIPLRAPLLLWQHLQQRPVHGALRTGHHPLMLATALAGQFIQLKWRARLRKLVPVFLVLCGAVHPAGLNFDVPYGVSSSGMTCRMRRCANRLAR